MSVYAREISELISSQSENRIIEATALYESSHISASLAAYYKALERKTKSGELVHLAKGLYYRPRRTGFGVIPISEEEIIRHYTSGNSGIIIGYRLYSEVGLTTQISRRVEILSNNSADNVKHISSITVYKTEMQLTPACVNAVRTLEIIQNYTKIEDLNNTAFMKYMNLYAAEYSEPALEYVLAHRHYKKSTIAFLKSILDYKGIANSLNRYLSPMSKYKFPDVERIYATA